MNIEEAIRRLDTDEFVTLWTIQTLGAWEKFQKQGYLRGDGRRVWLEFKRAYLWLINEMEKRIVAKTVKKGFPVWAWYHPKPDLRGSRHLLHGISGERGVKIELKVKRDRVLFFYFQAWHHILNNWPLVGSENDHNIDPQENWDKLFDFDWLDNNGGGFREVEDHIQGVLYEIFSEDIQSVQFFTAR